MKRRVIRFIIGFWVVLICGIGSLFATSQQSSVQYDSSMVELRHIPGESLEKYRSDENFQYEYEPKVGSNFIQQAWLWFVAILASIFQNGAVGQLFEIVVYILIAVLIVISILKLSGVTVTSLFYGSPNKTIIPNTILDDNIHVIDFDSEINEAIKAKEYRKAVRLYYLFTLKKLSDKHLVVWEPGKTNNDYTYDLSKSELRQPFEKLSFFFEYAWYGNFTIGESLLDRSRKAFDEIDDKINKV